MINKKYLNISEVSKLLQIEEHKIRYWDSKDPNTKKYRVDGISTKSSGGTRYFNKENIKKLEKQINILNEGKINKDSIKLDEKILSSNNNTSIKIRKNTSNNQNTNNEEKIEQILYKMRLLLKNDNI